jgi:hypothetical protein
MDYNVLVYQVFSWLPFKLDLASKMYCIQSAPGMPGCQKVPPYASTVAGIAKQLASAYSFQGTQ